MGGVGQISDTRQPSFDRLTTSYFAPLNPRCVIRSISAQLEVVGASVDLPTPSLRATPPRRGFLTPP